MVKCFDTKADVILTAPLPDKPIGSNIELPKEIKDKKCIIGYWYWCFWYTDSPSIMSRTPFQRWMSAIASHPKFEAVIQKAKTTLDSVQAVPTVELIRSLRVNFKKERIPIEKLCQINAKDRSTMTVTVLVPEVSAEAG
jgi:hypothetical protein